LPHERLTAAMSVGIDNVTERYAASTATSLEVSLDSCLAVRAVAG
jgi:hypothetical protein